MNEFKVNEVSGELEELKWYKKLWVLVLFSIFMPIVALVLWFAFHFGNINSTLRKICITILLIIATLTSIAFYSSVSFTHNKTLKKVTMNETKIKELELVNNFI